MSLPHSLSLFLQGESINTLPTRHWITNACRWLRDIHFWKSTMCNISAPLFVSVPVRRLFVHVRSVSDWLTRIKHPEPGGMLLSRQKKRPLRLHYVSLGTNAFLLTFFFPISAAAQTLQTLRLIRLTPSCSMTSRSHCFYCSEMTGRYKEILEFVSYINRLYFYIHYTAVGSRYLFLKTLTGI